MHTQCFRNVAAALLLAGMKVPSAGAQAPEQSAIVAQPADYPTGPGTPLGERIAALIAGEPSAARAHWGIAVTALDGAPIYGLDEGKLFRPASNAKLFTTAAAMQLLGPQSTVTTEVSGGAADANGMIAGDVELRSDGDANLSAMAFPYVPMPGDTPASATPLKAIDDLAAQVAARGIKKIEGAIVGDDTQWVWEPYPQSWAIDDMVWDYGAPVSSLSVNDNIITLTVRPGARAGDAATVTQSPDVGFYTLNVHVNTIAAKSATRIAVDRPVGSRVVSVTGEMAAGGEHRESLAVIDPPLFAAMALRASLVAHGVAVEGEARAEERTSTAMDGFTKQSQEAIPALPQQGSMLTLSPPSCVDACPTVLASRASPSLAQDVMYTMKESQNLHAEMLLRRLGRAYGREASGAQGARVVRQFLLNAGIDGRDFVFYDGSGLSDHDLVTPRAAAQILAYAAKQPWFSQWKAALPVGGVDGTLAGRFKEAPLKGHVFAKTGTLGESRGLSGYVDCASGRQVIVSVYVDNHAPSGSKDRAVMDAIVAAVAASD